MATMKLSRRTAPTNETPPARGRASGGIARATATRWRRRKDARPQEILEAALAVFAKKGFAGARMDDIARAAKVAKGTIYLYFPSKEAVFKALAQEMLASQFTPLASLARDHQGPVAPLLADILRTLGRFVSTSDRVVLPKIVIAEAGNFPDLARIYRTEVIERGLSLFGALLQRGIESGEFRNVPIAHAVRLCIAPLLVAAFWRTTFAAMDAEPYDYAGLIETHISTLLHGLAREETIP
jgi:AcrR family transcriptional regulator